MYEADYTPIYPTDEELNILYHHGIKGQKWGIRRYQNKDGTLTEAGKRKLDAYREKEQAKVDKPYNKAADKYDSLVEKMQKKYGSDVTTDQLRGSDYIKINKAYSRLYSAEVSKEITDTYLKNMTYSDMTFEKKEKGKAFIKALFGMPVENTVGQYRTNKATNAWQREVEEEAKKQKK